MSPIVFMLSDRLEFQPGVIPPLHILREQEIETSDGSIGREMRIPCGARSTQFAGLDRRGAFTGRNAV